METRTSIPKVMSRLLLSVVLAISFMPCIPWANSEAQADESIQEGVANTGVYSVGTGTNYTTASPWKAAHDDCVTSILYTANDIASDAGVIKNLGFHFNRCSTDCCDVKYGSMRIYISSVDASVTTLDNCTTYPQNMTLVYDMDDSASDTGKLNCGSDCWQTFNLTNPYTWNGTSNLIITIATDINVITDVSPCVWATETSANVVKTAGDGIGSEKQYLFATPGETIPGDFRTLRPNVRFGIAAAAPSTSSSTTTTPVIGATPIQASVDISNWTTPTVQYASGLSDVTYEWICQIGDAGYTAIEDESAVTENLTWTVPSDVDAGTPIKLFCRVDFTYGGEAKSLYSAVLSYTAVTATPVAEPAITIDPAEPVVYQYMDDVTLTAATGFENVTEGVGTVACQWYKSATEDGDYTAIDGATGLTYTVSSETAVGDTYYKFKVTNTFENVKVATASKTVKVSVVKSAIDKVILGTGTKYTSDRPYRSTFKYSLCETVYTASEITAAGGAAGYIKDLAFQVAAAGWLDADNVKIYMGATSEGTMSAQVPAKDLKKVYDNSIGLGAATGWETITLDTPYLWDGTSNLVIAVSREDDTYSAVPTYYCTSCKDYMVWCRSDDNDSAFADLENTETKGETSVYRPNIKMTIERSLDPVATISQTSMDPQEVGGIVKASVDTSKTVDGTAVDADRVKNMTYQWYYTINGGEPHAVEGETSSAVDFVVPEVQNANTIDLYCTVTYELDGVEKSVTSKSLEFLAVSGSPATLPEPTVTCSKNYVVQGGDSAILTADPGLIEDDEGVGTITYQWYKSNSADGSLVAILDATEASYEVKATSSLDDVYYTVKVANTYQSVKVAEGVSEAVKIETHALKIDDCSDWIAFAEAVNNGYSFADMTVYITDDIDFSSLEDDFPIAGVLTSAVPYLSKTSFKGTLDGQGHSLSNITITNDSDGSTGYGLFGGAYGATFKNLKVTNLSISEKDLSARTNVGGLVGFGQNITIENVGVEGTIDAATSTAFVGGLAGAVAGFVVKNCYFIGKVAASDESEGAHVVGGLIGLCESAGSSAIQHMYDSYAIATLTNAGTGVDPYVLTGGLFGLYSRYSTNDGITNNYFYGSLSNSNSSRRPAAILNSSAATVSNLPMSADKPNYYLDDCGTDSAIVNSNAKSLSTDFCVAKKEQDFASDGVNGMAAILSANALEGDSFIPTLFGCPIASWARTDDPYPLASFKEDVSSGVLAGTTVSLMVDASKTIQNENLPSNVKITGYQWYMCNESGYYYPIEGKTSTTMSYTLPVGAHPGDDYTFICRVYYTIGSVASSAISDFMTVYVVSDTAVAVPKVTVTPKSDSVMQRGDSVTFTADSGLTEGAVGVGTVTYQWYRSDSADGEFTAIYDADSATYVASPEEEPSDTYYKVVVTNTFEGAKVAVGEAVAKFTTEENPVKLATLGDEQTGSSRIPFGNYYEYSLAESLYSAEDILAAGGTAGAIQSLAFDVASEREISSNIKIYMGTTSATKLTGQVDASTLTLVYSNEDVTIGSAQGWETYTLDTPFEWDGNSSLIIAVSRTSDTYRSGLKYYCSMGSGGVCWSRDSDSNVGTADIANTEIAGDLLILRPDIQLSILESTDPVATISATTCDPKVAGETACASVDLSKTFSGKDADVSKVSDATYQWKYAVDGGEAVEIAGANAAEVDFVVPDLAVGSTVDLYCTVSYKLDGVEKSSTSKPMEFLVVSATPAAMPNPALDSTQLTIPQNGDPVTLTVDPGLSLGDEGVGDITCQWYEGDSANGEFTAIEDETDFSYTVSAEASVGTKYYKAVITNTFEKVKVVTGCVVAKVTIAESAYKIIGDGTHSDYDAPFYSPYKNGLSEILYTAEEIKAAGGAAGLIKELAFKVKHADELASSSIKIYIGTTSATAMTGQVSASDLKLVYSKEDTSIGAETGWETYTLDEPYEWDGVSNLVIACSRTGNSYRDSLAYVYTKTSVKTVWCRGDDDIADAADATNATVECDYELSKYRPNLRLDMEKYVAKPAAKNGLTYNGTKQTGVAAGTGYTLSGTAAAIKAGTYTVTAKLKAGYVWADGSADDVVLTWSIGKKAVTAPVAKSFVYNGRVRTGVAAGVGYKLAGTVKATRAGSYKVTATLDANHCWAKGAAAAKTLTWRITKAAQSKAKIVTGTKVLKGCKKGKLKKKRTFLLAKSGILGGAKVTWKKMRGNKKITIAKTGKVTVKKGIKKGTYKVRVRMFVKASTNYKVRKVFKVIKIRVK